MFVTQSPCEPTAEWRVRTGGPPDPAPLPRSSTDCLCCVCAQAPVPPHPAPNTFYRLSKPVFLSAAVGHADSDGSGQTDRASGHRVTAGGAERDPGSERGAAIGTAKSVPRAVRCGTAVDAGTSLGLIGTATSRASNSVHRQPLDLIIDNGAERLPLLPDAV
jgi:hypothetical protein